MKNSNKQTPEAKEIAERFKHAMAVIRRLPMPKKHNYKSNWPLVLHDLFELMQQEKPKTKLGPPAAVDISKMEETISWLWLLDRVDERKVITMRAQKEPWKKILPLLGCGRTHAWEIYNNALTKIARRRKNA